MQSKSLSILGAGLLAVGLCVGGYSLRQSHLRSQKIAPFAGHIADYLSQPNYERGSDAETSPIPGRIITVHRGRKEVDPIYFLLPESLAARSPGEVGTIVWVEWGMAEVGHYEVRLRNGDTLKQPAYVQTCRLTVIDRETRTVLCSKEVRGPEPPARKRAGESVTGPKPVKEVVAYLTSLPR
jgi:hypothetical protein